MAAVALAVAPLVGSWENKPTIHLEDAWPIMEKLIAMTTNHIERRPEREISEDEFAEIFRMSLSMVTQESPHNYSRQLYDKFLKSIREYIQSEVLPSLRTKRANELFLMEFVQRWSRYKSMSQCLFYLFCALDEYFIPDHPGLSPLQETSTAHFRDLVFQGVKEELKYAIKALIKKVCEGGKIDMDLFKNVLDIFGAIGVDSYFIKSPDFFYDKNKSFEEVLSIWSAQLLVDEPSICFALFQHGKVNGLSRTYELLKKNNHLPKLTKMFKMHLTNEVADLLKKAGDSVSDKEVQNLLEQMHAVVLWEMVELYYKYVIYVTECFQGDTLFLEALRDSASSSLTTQFFATVCEELHRKNQKVSQAFKVKVNDKLTALIDEQRESEIICNGEKILVGQNIMMSMLKKVLEMLYSIEPECYEEDLVLPLIGRTKLYYCNKLAESLFCGKFLDFDDYINWVDKCLMQERKRANHYSPFTNIKDMLLQEVVSELVPTYFVALLRDGKVNDLSRMYIHFSEICGGMELILKTFEGHLKREIEGLPNHVNDSASNKEVFLWSIVVLHNKYEAYVTECFQGHACFREALREAFNVIFTRRVLANNSGAGLLANFCIDILKEGCSEMPIEGAVYKFIGGCLDKVARLRAYLSNKDHFDKICRDEIQIILQTCFAFDFDARDDDFICRMYRLFSNISIGQEPFISWFKTHLEHNMQAAGSASNKEGVVQEIIKVLEKYEARIANCFLGEKLFHKALDEVFEVFINKNVSGSSVAELLAAFCHDILCSKNLCSEDIEGYLDKVVILLTYINDKILFAEFYRKNLARRLLFKYNNADDELERSMLSKLKQQYGLQTTSQMRDKITEMEGMISDITVSMDNQTKFEKYVAAHAELNRPGIDLSVSVLTTTFWPSYKTFDIELPAEMAKAVKVFEEFYQTIGNWKRLNTWLFHLGTCHINMMCQTKKIELIVAPCQAALLVLFNEYHKLTYHEIVERLNLQDDVAKPVLHSLSCAEYTILIKEPADKTISSNDVFEFNSNFLHEEGIIKIRPPADLEKDVVEKVEKDWKYAIDASIVRIMKSRKVLGHHVLVSECIKDIHPPDKNTIEKRIDDLIRREYLERDKDNTNIYKYIN